MKDFTMTNPTDIQGVEEYKQAFWVPSIEEHRELSVWREANGTYAFTFYIGDEHYETGFSTGLEAYERGTNVLHTIAPDAQAPLS